MDRSGYARGTIAPRPVMQAPVPGLRHVRCVPWTILRFRRWKRLASARGLDRCVWGSAFAMKSGAILPRILDLLGCASLARAEDEDGEDLPVIAGLRFWFFNASLCVKSFQFFRWAHVVRKIFASQIVLNHIFVSDFRRYMPILITHFII